jgi:hypothetical protein
MRRTVSVLIAHGLLFALVLMGRAGETDSAAIINKAIKAHFPKGPDAKNKGLRTKSKGTLHIMGLDLDYNQEFSAQMPQKFKEVMELSVMGKNVTVTTVFNGKEGWILADGNEVKVTDEILTELKEAVYAMGLLQGVFLKDKALKYSVIGEVQVKGKPAIGVTVTRDGKRDISLYFDKTTGLIAKSETRKRDIMSGQEVTEERFISEYQDVADRKVAKKVEVLRDGKAFIEATVLEVQILERVDDGEFVQPK